MLKDKIIKKMLNNFLNVKNNIEYKNKDNKLELMELKE